MKKGKMILYEKETDYAIRFMEYINGIPTFPLDVQVFTNLDSISEYIESHEVALFLVSIDIKLKQLDLAHVKHVVYLTEDMEEEKIDAFIIYKFQSIEIIKKYLLLILNKEEEKKESLKRKDLELVGVCSPYGGSGKTLFSLAYGQAVSKKRSCLYIGMEAIKSFYNTEKGGSFSELLYYLKQEKGDLENVIEGLTNRVGELECISSPDCFHDIYDVEQKDIDCLFAWLYKQEEYDVILFDIGIWNDITMYLFRRLDKIYMLRQSINKGLFTKESYLYNVIEKEQDCLLDSKIFELDIPYDEDIAKGNFKIEKLYRTSMGQWIWNIRENELINVNKN